MHILPSIISTTHRSRPNERIPQHEANHAIYSLAADSCNNSIASATLGASSAALAHEPSRLASGRSGSSRLFDTLVCARDRK